jgi:transcriptional regulator with XRE-family HTH domain
MDIPTAAAAAKSLGTIKRDGKKKSKREIEMETVWIKENALNKEEKSNFDWACALARGLFGEHAVGEVKVYLSTKLETAEEDVHCAGFFDPKGRGQIGLKRSILESRRDTFGTLGHEVGHAKRFRRYLSDWQDRSRGFEEELSDMIGALGEAIGEAGIDPTSLQASFQTKLEARDVYPGRRVRKGLVTPGTVTADLMKAAMKEAGYGSQRALAEAIYVKPSQVARVFKPSYTPPDYADLEAICDALGVNAAVVGLAKFVDYFQYYRKRAAERDKKVFPSGQQRRKMETLVSKLSESEIHAAAAQEVKGLMTGPFEPMSMDELQKPFLILLEQEKVRLAVEREAKTVGESHLVMS